jgi:decaprenylphospho-beta-D-ribofuranose 2-oxidase
VSAAAEVLAWAERAGVPCRHPPDYVVAPEVVDRDALLADRAGDFDFRTNPCVDFGKLVERVPLLVLRPRDRAELCECVRALGRAGLSYTVRGTGHCSGGQALGHAAVLDLGGLDRVLADDPAAEQITVEGGILWGAVVDALRGQGRRPLSIIANLRSTVAGTLAVGGFGDAAHLHGLTVGHVRALTLVTPDGESRAVTDPDPLFRLSLAGRGQLGVIAAATLTTVRRPLTLAGRGARWRSLEDFLEDAARIRGHEAYDFVRARLAPPAQGDEPSVVAQLGRAAAEPPRRGHDPGLVALERADVSPLEWVDLHALLSREPERTAGACPALELSLPLPHGLAAWRAMRRRLDAARLLFAAPRGPSVMLLPGRPARLPLAPLPASDPCFFVALRPELPVGEARAHLPLLAEIATAALEAGGRLYLMSIPVAHPRFLSLQLGDALEELRAHKRAVDPGGLLNPGFL